jgi:alpha-L-fucosidase
MEVSMGMTTTGPSKRPLPRWFDEAKFGVLVVWIPAAVPAFAPLPRGEKWEDKWSEDSKDKQWENSKALLGELPFAEMYQNTMHITGSPTAQYHAERYGELPYDSFVAEFRAGLDYWDPEPWADLFAQSGAKYVVLVAKHQDGFLLWPSATPNPYKPDWQAERDVVGELAAAVRARGLRFGILYTGGVDFTFGGLPFTDMEEMQAAIPQHQKYADYVDAHWRELVERYEPSILWNDMGYPVAADPTGLIEWYRDRIPDGVSNDRFSSLILEPGDQNYTDFATLEYQRNYERDAPAGRKWESTRGIGSSFGYNREETDETYASSTELIHELTDCVARGGNFLLSVGPTAAGKVSWAQAKRLLTLGWWLRDNGDAIYSTRPWARPAGTTGDGLEIRYTESDGAVHAIVLGTPATAEVELDVALDADAEVALEGSQRALRWQITPSGVRVELPDILDEQPAFALRLSPSSAVHPA